MKLLPAGNRCPIASYRYSRSTGYAQNRGKRRSARFLRLSRNNTD